MALAAEGRRRRTRRFRLGLGMPVLIAGVVLLAAIASGLQQGAHEQRASGSLEKAPVERHCLAIQPNDCAEAIGVALRVAPTGAGLVRVEASQYVASCVLTLIGQPSKCMAFTGTVKLTYVDRFPVVVRVWRLEARDPLTAEVIKV